MKVACTVWNGGKLGDNFKKLPIIISGGGGSAIAMYLLDNWEDKTTHQKHFGIIDQDDKYSQMEAYKFPEAKNVLKLPSALAHKVEMYACLTDMFEQNLIKVPKPLNLRQEFEYEDEDNNGQLLCRYVKAQPEEVRAMTEIDLTITEATLMQRSKTPNGNITIKLPKNLERKLHDDRAFCLAMLSYHLYQLRLQEQLFKEKQDNSWKRKYEKQPNTANTAKNKNKIFGNGISISRVSTKNLFG